MNTLHAQQTILDAIEKVFSGQWYCRTADLALDGTYTFTFVDVSDEAETVIEKVRAAKAVPILRDMLSAAEIHAGDEEVS